MDRRKQLRMCIGNKRQLRAVQRAHSIALACPPVAVIPDPPPMPTKKIKKPKPLTHEIIDLRVQRLEAMLKRLHETKSKLCT